MRLEKADRPPITLRPAQPEDMDAIEALFLAAIDYMRADGIEQWDEFYPDRGVMAADLQAGSLIVVESDGQMAAVVTLDENPYAAYADIPWQHPGARPIFVHRLCVHPSRQGKGIAREIMRHIEQIAQERGFEVIRLDTFIDNARALRLYEGLGYTRAGEMTARKGRFPCFEKRIAPESEG